MTTDPDRVDFDSESLDLRQELADLNADPRLDPPTGACGTSGYESDADDGEGSDFNGDLIPARIGEYVIERLIGSGGMGRVYLARHATMERTVAIKTLPPTRMRHARSVEQFYTEVRAAAKLLHPNIVTAFDAGHSDGVHYLAMEYVDGPTLTAMIADEGPLPVGTAVSIIRGAARGLAHAHAAGIVHRDVKPGNLMRASDGTVKVVDLGLASVTAPRKLMPAVGARTPRATVQAVSADPPSSAAMAGKLVGTVAFMSPEQLENAEHADAKSDIYSLGATLYFLLTGRPPYEGDFLDQVRGHRHDPLPELFALRPDVDLRLEHVFRRMMAKRPQERYGSLVEVISDLAWHDTTEVVPAWISSLGARGPVADPSTFRGVSTHSEVAKVFAIDLGMFYATTAVAEPTGSVRTLAPSENAAAQQRLAIADGQPPLFGDIAAARRESHPGSVMHCVPLYIGQSKIDYLVAGRRCPAEVLLAMQLRSLLQTAWSEPYAPQAIAITVPSCYDQFHRRSVLQAAAIAGFRSVRLVDRLMAALQAVELDQTTLVTPRFETNESQIPQTPVDPQLSGDAIGDRPRIVVAITGLATEVMLARRRGGRLQPLAIVGQWHQGTLQWQQRLIDLVIDACMRQHQIDPRSNLTTAARLQLAAERALPKFLLSDQTTISFRHRKLEISIEISRDQWLEACEPLIDEFMMMIDQALVMSSLNPRRIGQCILLGQITRIGPLRQAILAKFSESMQVIMAERSDLSRGAAACVAGELPGRKGIPLPPQVTSAHDLGLLVVDGKGRRRIRPVIPRGTSLPARTNRRIAASGDLKRTLSLVESSTWEETSWRSLGQHRLLLDEADHEVELTFEIDVDGLLDVRRRDTQSGSLQLLPSLPHPTLSEDEANEWTLWVAEVISAGGKSPPTT